jgi:hypothetical protein
VAHGIRRIETLLEEIIRHLEGDSDDDNDNKIETEIEDSSKHNNYGGNNDRAPDDTSTNNDCYENSSGYICPDEACRRRKADKQWKQYVRHYEIRNEHALLILKRIG